MERAELLHLEMSSTLIFISDAIITKSNPSSISKGRIIPADAESAAWSRVYGCIQKVHLVDQLVYGISWGGGTLKKSIHQGEI